MRELVVALDFPTYQTQRATRPGQYPGVGALLPSLKGGIPESWWRYLNGYVASLLRRDVPGRPISGAAPGAARIRKTPGSPHTGPTVSNRFA